MEYNAHEWGYKEIFTPDAMNHIEQGLKNASDEIANVQKNMTTPFSFKGSCTYSELPAKGNTLNDSYYVSDKLCNYSWNGSAWIQSSMNETQYQGELAQVKRDVTEKTDELREDLGFQKRHFRADELEAGAYNSSGKYNDNNASRVKEIKQYSYPITIGAEDGFEIMLYKYDDNDALEESIYPWWIRGEWVIPANTRFTVSIRGISGAKSTFEERLTKLYFYGNTHTNYNLQKSELENLKNGIEFYDWRLFEGGTISNGQNGNDQKCMRMKELMKHSTDRVISVLDSEYRFYAVFYDDSGAYIKNTPWCTTSLTIEANTSYRLVIGKVDNTSLVVNGYWGFIKGVAEKLTISAELRNKAIIDAETLQQLGEKVNEKLDEKVNEKVNEKLDEKLLLKQNYYPVKSYGHRGLSNLAPENTISAFRKAKQNGLDGVEIDLAVTSDGVIVVCHDGSVDRTSNGTGNIRDMTLAELKALDFGSCFSSDFVGEKIPTLEETVKYCKFACLDILLDLGGGAILNEVGTNTIIYILKKYDMLKHTMFACSGIEGITSVLEAYPKAKCCYTQFDTITTEQMTTKVNQLVSLKTAENELSMYIYTGAGTAQETIDVAISNDIPLGVWYTGKGESADNYVKSFVRDIPYISYVTYDGNPVGQAVFTI